MRTRIGVVAVLAALSVLVFGMPATADTPQERLARAEDELDELSRELEIQIEECNLRREQRKEADQAVQDNRQRYRKTERRLHNVREEHGDIVAQMYMDSSAGQQLSQLMVPAGSLSDYAERVTWLDITQDSRASSLERFTSVQDRLHADSEVLEATQQAAKKAEKTAQRSCERARDRVEKQESEIAELSELVERLEARARARQQRESQATTQTSTAGTAPQAAPNPPAVSGGAGGAVRFALAQVGKPYAWGASGPSAYDCSGLTMAAWAAAGVSLPHNSGMQYGATSRVSRSALQPGDLTFYGSPIHHVAMYIGNGQIVDAPRTGLTVRVTSVDYQPNYVGAGRP